jgi:seryl-tRNA synthetase
MLRIEQNELVNSLVCAIKKDACRKEIFMARTRSTVSIDDKIEKAQWAVERSKKKYDVAVAELKDLMKKKDEMKRAELMDAVEKSDKSFEDIMAFLKEKNDDDFAE